MAIKEPAVKHDHDQAACLIGQRLVAVGNMLIRDSQSPEAMSIISHFLMENADILKQLNPDIATHPTWHRAQDGFDTSGLSKFLGL